MKKFIEKFMIWIQRILCFILPVVAVLFSVVCTFCKMAGFIEWKWLFILVPGIIGLAILLIVIIGFLVYLANNS